MYPSFRFVAAFCAVAAVAACDEGIGPIPDGSAPAVVQTPLNIAAARDNLRTTYPDATSFGFLDRRGEGFVVRLDGTAEYRPFNSNRGRRTQTTVQQLDAETVCLAPAEGWSGACLNIIGEEAGPLTVAVTFGNGSVHSYTSTLEVDPD
jgi:hypothetical protein